MYHRMDRSKSSTRAAISSIDALFASAAVAANPPSNRAALSRTSPGSSSSADSSPPDDASPPPDDASSPGADFSSPSPSPSASPASARSCALEAAPWRYPAAAPNSPGITFGPSRLCSSPAVAACRRGRPVSTFSEFRGVRASLPCARPAGRASTTFAASFSFSPSAGGFGFFEPPPSRSSPVPFDASVPIPSAALAAATA